MERAANGPRQRRGLRRLGLGLIAAGLLTLEFTAFQFLATDLVQHRSQQVLAKAVDVVLPPPVKRWDPAAPTPLERGPEPALAQPLGRIAIPAIGLNQVVLQGTSTGVLSAGPGHYPGTAMPGEAGNVAIAGHRTTWGRPFWALDALRPGDEVVLSTPRGRFRYRVDGESVVDPTDTSVLTQAVAAPTLTLTTCTPRFSAAKRLVLRATLASQVTVQPAAVKQVRYVEHAAATEQPPLLASWLLALLWLVVGLAGLQLALSLRSRTNFLLLSAIGIAALPLAFLASCYWISPVLPPGL